MTTPDQPLPEFEAEERYFGDAAFHARVKYVRQNIVPAPNTETVALILVLDERARAEMASRRPDNVKELQLLAQQAGYLDIDGEPTKKLRDALYGDLAWNTNPVMVLSTEMQQAIAKTRTSDHEFVPCQVCGGHPESTLHLGFSLNGHHYVPAQEHHEQRE